MLISGSLFFMHDDIERRSRRLVKFNSALQLLDKGYDEPEPE